jgi:replicative DNA helicase
MEERYTEAVRFVQETPWDVINELLDGGLGKGELGVMVAPAGIGKSWALMNIGANAVKKGKTVLHYTLELNEAYVGLRYDSVITGIANQNLKHYQDDIKEQLEKLDGELIIKHYPTKTVSVMGIRAHVEKCIMQDKKPDVIIVDYADLIRGHGQEKRHELEGIYEDLRGMAGEYEIPVWTASQANRSALEEDVIDASKVSESYGKVMVADFVLSLSRKVQDKLAGTGRWHVIKNRFGPDGITLPSKMNTSNGQFNIYTDTSLQGQNTQKQMDNGDNLAKQLLARKYKETQNTGFE